jgi:VacB/RNase II family 3'-5' exoribonuclease
MHLVRGRISAHRDGFGFLLPEDGSDDLFLAPRQMRTLMHGDRVLARVAGIDHRGRREGALVEVLERQHTTVVGRFFVDGDLSWVHPEDKRLPQDVLVNAPDRGEAVQGQMVVVEITAYPEKRQPAVGRIVEVLGEHMAPGMEIDVAIRAHELPVEWPVEVLAEADALPDTVPATAKAGRVDLTGVPLVTIEMHATSTTRCSPSRPMAAGGCWSRSPTSRPTSRPAAHSTARRKRAATRSTSPAACCRCCPRRSPTGSARSTRRSTGSASSARCRSRRTAR